MIEIDSVRLRAAVKNILAGVSASSGVLVPVTAGLIAEYDPVYEIVIQFRHDAGQIRTQRPRTAPGRRHPKRVFFFEMLRRINEEFDTVDARDLPDWFINALKELNAAREDDP